MKALTTAGLTKLIQLIKSSFIKTTDTVTTNTVTLATVATSGSYNDLSNTPSLSGYQTTANLVTSVSSSSTNSQYPSAKCVYDIVGNIETLLSNV